MITVKDVEWSYEMKNVEFSKIKHIGMREQNKDKNMKRQARTQRDRAEVDE